MNVPITFPSSFLATDSQSCTAISAATFFASRRERSDKEVPHMNISHGEESTSGIPITPRPHYGSYALEHSKPWEPPQSTPLARPQTYQSSDPSSSPARGPCPASSGSWSPPGLSTCQTCPPGHPSLRCEEAEELPLATTPIHPQLGTGWTGRWRYRRATRLQDLPTWVSKSSERPSPLQLHRRSRTRGRRGGQAHDSDPPGPAGGGKRRTLKSVATYFHVPPPPAHNNPLFLLI